MIFKALSTFVFVFVFGTLLGQQQNQQMHYKRYEGNIGQNINITANIVRLNSKLQGNYQYAYLEDNGKMHYGKTVELNGEIDKNDTATLKEFGRDEYAFKGKMDKDVYRGSWHAPDNKNVPFEMKEYYPNGSMAFEVHYLRSEGSLNEKENDSPVAEIELTLLYPKMKYFEPRIVDSVRKIISRSFFGKHFEKTEPDSMLVHFEQEYLDNFIKQNENWNQQGMAFDWEKTQSMSVIYNSNYLLCLEYLRYAYSGGAHGMSNISCDIIYLDEGKVLTYTDIFAEDADSALAVLLTRQLRKDYRIPEEVGLKDAGFFVDEVKPNHNIYVDGNGIGFIYNAYEIAPYAKGATDIFLHFDQIEHLIKKGTPVYQMRQR